MNIRESIVSEKAPKAIGPYSPALAVGDFIMLSGQLGVDPDTGHLKEGIVAQTVQALENIKAILNEAGLEMRHIIKTTVYLQNMHDFDQMNAVYKTYFTAPYPARSAVQIAALPKGGLVEIEAFAIDTRALEVMDTMCEGECCGCCHE